MRTLIALSLVLSVSSASAQEFEPFPQARITVEQWQAYFNEVSEKLAATRQRVPAEHYVGFSDDQSYTTYTFTEPGHPAHPAWITRQIVQDGTSINVRQIGYYAGKEEPFAKLYRAFQRMNDRLREDMQRRTKGDK